MNLFQKINFKSHSGKQLDWKIEADALTDDDIECLAYLISKKYRFYKVIGIPRGGIRLQIALQKYLVKDSDRILIVDDVLTTGRSMRDARDEAVLHERHFGDPIDIDGVVVFARGRCPSWIKPIFQFFLY